MGYRVSLLLMSTNPLSRPGSSGPGGRAAPGSRRGSSSFFRIQLAPSSAPSAPKQSPTANNAACISETCARAALLQKPDGEQGSTAEPGIGVGVLEDPPQRPACLVCPASCSERVDGSAAVHPGVLEYRVFDQYARGGLDAGRYLVQICRRCARYLQAPLVDLGPVGGYGDAGVDVLPEVGGHPPQPGRDLILDGILGDALEILQQPLQLVSDTLHATMSYGALPQSQRGCTSLSHRRVAVLRPLQQQSAGPVVVGRGPVRGHAERQLEIEGARRVETLAPQAFGVRQLQAHPVPEVPRGEVATPAAGIT